MAGEEIVDVLSIDGINYDSGTPYNDTMYTNSESWESEYDLSNETMRLLFITIATISVLACLSICLSVFICVCLNR